MSKSSDGLGALAVIIILVFAAGLGIGVMITDSYWENRVVDNYTLIEAIRVRVAAERAEDDLK